ncbi:hypothetical protein [Labilibacter marinus]|uniref:hypothetical protein n=1 Tax=Labilibacter marinus TaxID=1477105 RepID=UPI00082D006F|nr:hypothetical protein [Labilibacter marinus]
MKNHEIIYVKHSVQLIEDKLNWLSADEWKQRDYLHLIDLIEEKTKVKLSLSTIKRIWKKDYEGIPHHSTLEVFAQFLDYKSWLEFKDKNKHIIQNIEEISKAQPRDKTRFNKRWTIVLGSFIMVGFVCWLLMGSFQSKEVFYHPEDVNLACKNSVSVGVPNTVVFSYEASKVKADSFFIQQSWNKFRRDKIQPTGTHLTSTYFYPGFHKAKLIANDSIIKQTEVMIQTDGMLVLSRDGYMDESPIYIRKPSIFPEGYISVSENDLSNHGVLVTQESLLSYFYVQDIKGLSSLEYSFETRLKCDSIMNLNCPNIDIVINGKENMNFFRLTMPGCIGKASMKVGHQMLSGKNNDLSFLGVDLYHWQTFKIKIKDGLAKVFINDVLLKELTVNKGIGDIVGFNLNFSGTGSVDFVNLSNKDGQTIYKNNF